MTFATTASCPATLIAAPASRHGKTIITAGLARRYKNMGKRVRVFKIGPDFLDPTILQIASGHPVYNLDLWMMGQDHCRQLLFEGARQSDVLLVESLMGLHDNEPSSAQLANLFGLPVTLVMNVAKFAQTASALLHGLESYGCTPRIQQVIGNRVGSDNHHRLMVEALGDRYAGSVRREDVFALPERHLGLVSAGELAQLDDQLDGIAQCLDDFKLDCVLQEVSFKGKPTEEITRGNLHGRKIAVAKDAAFSFIYPANIDFLCQRGASVEYFSPLGNESVPECDALWMPGGYPELHMAEIAAANQTRDSLLAFQKSGRPILAECGGMMALAQSITSKDGNIGNGFGLIDAHCRMLGRFQSIGLQSVDYGFGQIRGHGFHHSSMQSKLHESLFATKQNGDQGEAIYRVGNSILTYLHHYFPSHPDAAERLFT